MRGLLKRRRQRAVESEWRTYIRLSRIRDRAELVYPLALWKPKIRGQVRTWRAPEVQR